MAERLLPFWFVHCSGCPAVWFILDQGVGVPVTDLDRAQAFCEAVLAGQGELRHGNRRCALREGDVIGCPAGGPETAHAITNTGLTELRNLAISSQDLPEICDYPDSGKFGIFDAPTPGAAAAAAPPFRFISRPGQQLDYWDGE